MKNENWTKIDMWRLSVLLTPICLRKPLFVTLLKSVTQPLMILHSQWYRYRDDVNYRILHNGQVCHLEGMLNDAFDVDQRRIYIMDAEIAELDQFLWLESADRPVMLGVFMLEGEGYLGTGGKDFVVVLPIGMHPLDSNELTRMQALINYYKLAGKKYSILYK